MKRTLLRLVASTLLVAACGSALAAIDLVGDDTDLFTTNPNIPSQIPGVLLVVDNTANWSSQSQGWEKLSDTNDSVCKPADGWTGSEQGTIQLCALYKVLNNVDEQVTVGMMFPNDSSGGYVRFPLKAMNSTNKTALLTMIKNIATVTGVGDEANKGPSNLYMADVMNDAFRYLNGFAVFGKPQESLADTSAYTDGATKTVFKAGTDKSNSCGYAYIVWISNGASKQENSDYLQAAANLLTEKPIVNTTVLQTSGVNTDVWSRFLFQYGVEIKSGVYRHITTYTIEICKASCDKTQGDEQNRDLLKSAAAISQGKYFRASNLQSIETALNTIFAEVQAVNSVFAATTLPVSINVRGTNLNQVYIGVFRPDPGLSPRWMGNLKQYKLGIVDAANSTLGLIDDSTPPASAVNLNTGFISNTASSIWSETVSGSGYWNFRGTYPATDVGKDQDRPDGDLVEKGGAAQKLRKIYASLDSSSASTRNVYTCTPCTSADLNSSCSSAGACAAGKALSSYKFNDSNGDITAASLGAFVPNSVSLLTGSGSTAKATISGGHTFNVGDFVVISGATPASYNSANSPTGYWTVASKDTTNTPSQWFTYSIASGTTTTFDTTHAYATFTGYNNSSGGTTTGGLRPGTDIITVTGASPSDYNQANVAITAASGNANNQFSYLLPTSNNATSVASSYTVTATRLISSLVYSSATGLMTAVVPYHPYTGSSTGIVVAGAVKTEFNHPNITSITVANAGTASASFTYAPYGSAPSGGTVTLATATVPGGFPGGTLTGSEKILICSGTPTTAVNGAATLPVTCPTSTNFNSSGSGSSVTVTNAASNIFTYTVSGTVSGSGGTGFTATRVVTDDANRYAKNPTTALSNSSTPLGTAGSTTRPITFSVTFNSTETALHKAGQNQRTIAIGDTITVTGLTCRKTAGGGTQLNCGGTDGLVPTITSTYDVVVTAVTPNTSITWAIPKAVDDVTVSATAQFVWYASKNSSKPTFSTPAALDTTGPVAQALTVTDTSTVATSKLTGDLASGGVGLVTSITSQAVATGAITASNSLSSDSGERTKVINWVRGQDNKDQENSDGATTDIRASVHGDVLHSRPAVINYNRYSTSSTVDDNDVFVFYGANDGLLHAIKGGSNATDGGKEQWAFAAPEFFSKYKRMRDKNPLITPATPRDYFFDGPIAAYTLDAAPANGKLQAVDSDKVWLFVGMRRGGRKIYAFDLTDPTAPKLLWAKGCTKATGGEAGGNPGSCDTGWGMIGQTWSQPQLAYLRRWPDKLVLIFGAGYDPTVEDLQPCYVSQWFDATTGSASVTAKTNVVVPTPMDKTKCNAVLADTSLASLTKPRTMGRGIFIVDASNGNVLYRIGPDADATKVVPEMAFAMPGDLAVLRNRDNGGIRTFNPGTESAPVGYMDRIYATDTGGNVWRIDVADDSGIIDDTPPNFVVSRLAALASTSVSTGGHPAENYRKLMFSPDVVYTTETDGSKYDAVMVGSGDREHPFDMTVNNRFYMIKDLNTGTLAAAAVPVTTGADSLTKWKANGMTALVTDTRPSVGVSSDASTTTSLYDVTNNCLQDSTKCDTAGGQDQTVAKNGLKAAQGWKLLYPNTGEKTVATPTTAAGTVIFNTNQPKQDTVTGTGDNTTNGVSDAGACVSDLGTARQYGISYLDATSKNIFSSLPTQYLESGGRDAMFAGGGFLPTPVPVVVQIDGKYYQTVIAGVQTTNPGGLKFQSRLRTYWFRKTD